MIKVKSFGRGMFLAGLAIVMVCCEISPPQGGERLSEIEQMYNQGNYKDAMNVARYNLKNNPQDPASVVTVWKVQVLQGTKSKVYVQQMFKAVRERLSDFGNPIILYLGRGMTDDASNPVRLFCLLCLGELPEVSSSEQIVKVLDPGYTLGNKPSDITLGYLQGEAALILAMRRYTEAFEGIAALTGSEDEECRGKAAMALGYLGDQRALPILEKLTGDQSKTVAAKADSAIAFIKGQ